MLSDLINRLGFYFAAPWTKRQMGLRNLKLLKRDRVLKHLGSLFADGMFISPNLKMMLMRSDGMPLTLMVEPESSNEPQTLRITLGSARVRDELAALKAAYGGNNWLNRVEVRSNERGEIVIPGTESALSEIVSTILSKEIASARILYFES